MFGAHSNPQGASDTDVDFFSIHDQVGELSAVFCIPRSRGEVRFREEVFPEPSELAGTLGERRGVVLECL